MTFVVWKSSATAACFWRCPNATYAPRCRCPNAEGSKHPTGPGIPFRTQSGKLSLKTCKSWKSGLLTAHSINPPTGAHQAEGGDPGGVHWVWDQQQVHRAERDGSAGLPGQGADQLLHEAVLRPHPPLRHRTDRQHGPGGDPPQQASQVPVLLLPLLSPKVGGWCHTSMRIVKLKQPTTKPMHAYSRSTAQHLGFWGRSSRTGPSFSLSSLWKMQLKIPSWRSRVPSARGVAAAQTSSSK